MCIFIHRSSSSRFCLLSVLCRVFCLGKTKPGLRHFSADVEELLRMPNVRLGLQTAVSSIYDIACTIMTCITSIRQQLASYLYRVLYCAGRLHTTRVPRGPASLPQHCKRAFWPHLQEDSLLAGADGVPQPRCLWCGTEGGSAERHGMARVL